MIVSGKLKKYRKIFIIKGEVCKVVGYNVNIQNQLYLNSNGK